MQIILAPLETKISKELWQSVPDCKATTTSAESKVLQGREDCLRLHAFAELDIGLPRFDKAVGPDDELRCDREEKGLISMVFLKFNPRFIVQPLYLGADPEDKPKRKRITEVNVAQNGKWQIVARDIGVREPCSIRHYRNDPSPKPLYLVVNCRKRSQLKLAVWAPMSAVDADHHRSRLKQARQRNQTSTVVW